MTEDIHIGMQREREREFADDDDDGRFLARETEKKKLF